MDGAGVGGAGGRIERGRLLVMGLDGDAGQRKGHQLAGWGTRALAGKLRGAARFGGRPERPLQLEHTLRCVYLQLNVYSETRYGFASRAHYMCTGWDEA